MFKVLTEVHLNKLEKILNEKSQTPFFSGKDEFNAVDVIIHGEV